MLRIAVPISFFVALFVALAIVDLAYPDLRLGRFLPPAGPTTYVEICQQACPLTEPLYRIRRADFDCPTHCSCVADQVAKRYDGGADALLQAQMALDLPDELSPDVDMSSTEARLAATRELFDADSPLSRQLRDMDAMVRGTKPHSAEVDRYLEKSRRLSRILLDAEQRCLNARADPDSTPRPFVSGSGSRG